MNDNFKLHKILMLGCHSLFLNKVWGGSVVLTNYPYNYGTGWMAFCPEFEVHSGWSVYGNGVGYFAGFFSRI